MLLKSRTKSFKFVKTVIKKASFQLKSNLSNSSRYSIEITNKVNIDS